MATGASMFGSKKYINSVSELKVSVMNFMGGTCHDWKEACGSNPKYFVCISDGRQQLFGLSKFCALRNITMTRYKGPERRRITTDGNVTQQRIAKVVAKEMPGRKWILLAKAPPEIRAAFVLWFQFFPNGERKKVIWLMLLS